MASIASVYEAVKAVSGTRRYPASGSDGALQRTARRDHFPAVIMSAMAANMVRALQLPAIATLGMLFFRQRLMAAAHARAGGGSLSLGYSHGTKPLFE